MTVTVRRHTEGDEGLEPPRCGWRLACSHSGKAHRLALLLGVLLSSCSHTPDGLDCRPSFEVPLRRADVDYLEFIAVGDTGSGDTNQSAVAESMALLVQTNPVEFVLLLGDNFYEDGVSSVDDPLWQSRFESMYGPIDRPFYAVLGNHDYRGSAQAQIDYSAMSDLWTMPARYYSFSRVLADGTSARFVALDTNTIAGDGDQQAWLEDLLTSSPADWTIVFGHHPLVSNGFHGDNATLLGILESLFVSSGVDVYVAGHDHDLQVLDPRNGVTYLVSGAGSRLRKTACGENTAYAASDLGYMTLRLSRNELTILVVLADGRIDYAKIVEPAR